MLRVLLTSAAMGALIFNAAAATEASDKPAMTKYQPAEAVDPIKPAEVATREDAAKLADWQFELADVNADGAIDAEEFAAFVAVVARDESAVALAKAEKSDAAFANIAKADKLISKEELVEARAKSFDAADADGSKSLDPLEQQRFAALVAAKPATRATPQ